MPINLEWKDVLNHKFEKVDPLPPDEMEAVEAERQKTIERKISDFVKSDFCRNMNVRVVSEEEVREVLGDDY